MPSSSLPLGISPAEFDKLAEEWKRNRAKKEFALNNTRRDEPALPIPNWNQVIRIDPGLPSPREYLMFVGVDIGLVDLDSLSPETRKAVARRVMIAERVRSESMPDWRQKMVTVMTALDNAEDVISTMAWILGPYLEKTGRPGKLLVRGAKGTSSSINFINRFLRGPELTRKTKHRYMDERKMNAKDRVMRGAPKSKAGKWLQNNLGNLIQAAQASESLTGVGLQLGTIYGTLENALWDDSRTLLTVGELFADRALRDVGFFRPEALPIIAKRIEDNERILKEQPEPWIKRMANWINANSTNNVYKRGLPERIQALTKIIADNPYYTIEEHGMALTAFNMWAIMAGDTYRAHLDGMDLERFATLKEPVPAAWNHISRSIMQGYGIQFDANQQPIGQARIRPRPIMEAARQTSADFLRNHNAWLPSNTDTDTNNFLHSMTISAATLTGGILSTTGDPLTIAKTLDEDLVYYALDQAAVPPRDATEKDLQRWATYMKAHCGPDLANWRRGGFQRMNMAYWRALGRQPAPFNN